MELFTTVAIGPNAGLCRCACWANHPTTIYLGRRWGLVCEGVVPPDNGDVCASCIDAMGATYTAPTKPRRTRATAR